MCVCVCVCVCARVCVAADSKKSSLFESGQEEEISVIGGRKLLTDHLTSLTRGR